MAQQSRRGRNRRFGAAGAAAKRGQAPGAAVYVGPQRDASINLVVMDYSPDGVEERNDVTLDEVQGFIDRQTVSWINVDGIHDAELVQKICTAFQVHPVAVEDILDPSTRVKVEDFGDSLFVICKMQPPEVSAEEIEQLALVLGPTWVLTFQERVQDGFDPLRKRIRSGTGRIRRMRSDYLLHAVIDGVVDNYFSVLERMEGFISELEVRAFDEDLDQTARAVHALFTDLRLIRRAVWPLRDVTQELLRSEGRLIHADTLPFFRDLHDHVLQVIDVIDGQRERLRAVLDLQLALTSHRMNEVMRTLTVVATMFIPLTFVVGVYGMNFDHMPELHFRYGYAAVWVLMGVLTAGMIAYFRRTGWW